MTFQHLEERLQFSEKELEIDAPVADGKEMMIYRMVAEKNPEMAAMLDEYAKLDV